MDAWTHVITDGNVIMKILVLQVLAALLVLFVLKKLCDRELFACALEKFSHLKKDENSAVHEVVVVAAEKLSGADEARLRALIHEKLDIAEIIIGEDGSLWGGIVIRSGGDVLDFSLQTKIRQIFKC